MNHLSSDVAGLKDFTSSGGNYHFQMCHNSHISQTGGFFLVSPIGCASSSTTLLRKSRSLGKQAATSSYFQYDLLADLSIVLSIKCK